MEDKETGKLTYDDRRKELIQEKSQEKENKEGEDLISTVSQSMKVVYTEKGIKLAHKNLQKEKDFLDKRVSDLKKQIEDVEKMPEEEKKKVEEFREMLKKLQKLDAADKLKTDLETANERMKLVKKELGEIKDTIGSRLKF